MISNSRTASISCIETKPEVINHILGEIRHLHGVAESVFSGNPKPRRRSRNTVERRNDQRIEFEVPIYLQSVVRLGNRVAIPGDPPAIGMTRDISTKGFGFLSDLPVTARHYLAEFDLYGQGPCQLIIEIRWQRSQDAFSELAGGEVVGVVVEDN